MSTPGDDLAKSTLNPLRAEKCDHADHAPASRDAVAGMCSSSRDIILPRDGRQGEEGVQGKSRLGQRPRLTMDDLAHRSRFSCAQPPMPNTHHRSFLLHITASFLPSTSCRRVCSHHGLFDETCGCPQTTVVIEASRGSQGRRLAVLIARLITPAGSQPQVISGVLIDSSARTGVSGNIVIAAHVRHLCLPGHNPCVQAYIRRRLTSSDARTAQRAFAPISLPDEPEPALSAH